VYRIVQEALTNARKHAPGARVTVRVRYGPDEVRLEIRNTPPTGPGGGEGGGAGAAHGRCGPSWFPTAGSAST
jgi:signal transduction histidine kinase